MDAAFWDGFQKEAAGKKVVKKVLKSVGDAKNQVAQTAEKSFGDHAGEFWGKAKAKGTEALEYGKTKGKAAYDDISTEIKKSPKGAGYAAGGAALLAGGAGYSAGKNKRQNQFYG